MKHCTIKLIDENKWNTYRCTGYTHDVADDQRSAGGVHLHQVRRGPRGWQTRICQSNGGHFAYGPVTNIDQDEGSRLFEMAKNY